MFLFFFPVVSNYYIFVAWDCACGDQTLGVGIPMVGALGHDPQGFIQIGPRLRFIIQ